MQAQVIPVGARRPLIDTVGDHLGRWVCHWRRARQQARTRRVMQALSDETLRDIGLVRAEIGSIVAELYGDVRRTRALTHRPSCRPR